MVATRIFSALVCFLAVGAFVSAAFAQTDEELRQMYFQKNFGPIENLARAGDVRAEAWMGLIMQQAHRRPEAKEWWRRAAAQRHRHAYGPLAQLYAAGRGTVRDPIEAYALADIAETVLTDSETFEIDKAKALKTQLAVELASEQLTRAVARASELRPDLSDLKRRATEADFVISLLVVFGIFVMTVMAIALAWGIARVVNAARQRQRI